MLVYCDHCHEETNQILVSVNSSRISDKILLTVFRCHQCWKYNYSMTDRTKYDTNEYPYLPRFKVETNEKFVMIIDSDDFIKDVLDE